MSGTPLRIAQFITQYPYPKQFETPDNYYCGGAEVVAQKISETLADLGHDIHVFTSAAGSKYEETLQEGVKIHRSPNLIRINTTQIAPTMLWDHIRTKQFDIIHAHNSTPPAMLAACVNSKLSGAPLVITHHGGEHYESHGGVIRRGGLFLYTQFLLDDLFNHAERVIIPSEGYMAESRVLSNPGVNVQHIPNGVNIDKFCLDMSPKESKCCLGYDPETFIILYLGSHHMRKGPDILLEAFESVIENVGKVQLIMGGSGDLTPYLQQKARRAGLDNQVDFPGYIPESKKAIYFTASDLFILPSRTAGAEMFPLAILEAAAAGTPVVTSDFPALRSVVDKYGIGVLVPPNNVSYLASTLTELYKSEVLNEFQNNAVQMATEHNWKVITDEYLRLYWDIIS